MATCSRYLQPRAIQARVEERGQGVEKQPWRCDRTRHARRVVKREEDGEGGEDGRCQVRRERTREWEKPNSEQGRRVLAAFGSSIWLLCASRWIILAIVLLLSGQPRHVVELHMLISRLTDILFSKMQTQQSAGFDVLEIANSMTPKQLAGTEAGCETSATQIPAQRGLQLGGRRRSVVCCAACLGGRGGNRVRSSL